MLLRIFLFTLAVVVVSAQCADTRSYLKKPGSWFGSEEAARVAENILSFQTPRGDWPKNTDVTSAKFEGDIEKTHGTFDNSATIPELKFLARIFNATKGPKYEEAFSKGLDHVLAAQYTNGGWPQSFPVSKGYDRHITFNDDAMVNIMNFVREVNRDPVYDFLSGDKRERAGKAFDRGVECILKCQIKIGGKLTAWCAQHDEVDLSPAPARKYELASVSGGESAGITRLLMSIERPTPETVAAVDGAVAWFESVKLTGIRQTQVPDPRAPKGMDKRIVEDPSAPPLWARFYDLKTMKPMFVDRDGIPREHLSDIGYERRNGYAWLGTAPAAVLAEYPEWKKAR